MLLGTLGFSLGFFGPLLLMPDANQGPLLGLFFMGPLGGLLGAVAGGLSRAPSSRGAYAARASIGPTTVLATSGMLNVEKRRVSMTIAIVTILLGALALAGGLQELVAQGILNSQKIPLLGGTMGAVSGALLVAAGIALLRRSPRAAELTRAAALTAIPIYLLIGQLMWGLAGWAVTLLGLAWPALLLVATRTSGQGGRMIRA